MTEQGGIQLFFASFAMQSVLIKLVADKEEAEVAKVIDKTIRRQSGAGIPGGRPEDALVWPGSLGTRKVRTPAVEMLFLRRAGYFARDCDKKV